MKEKLAALKKLFGEYRELEKQMEGQGEEISRSRDRAMVNPESDMMAERIIEDNYRGLFSLADKKEACGLKILQIITEIEADLPASATPV